MPTPRLKLPYIAQGQAQKEVTHNDALNRLDALVDLYLLDRYINTPPSSPSDGDAYITGDSPTGAWSGHPYKIATVLDGAWRIFDPFKGLRAYVADEEVFVVWDGSSWVDWSTTLTLNNVPSLGIGTTADATNKLAVTSDAAYVTTDTGDVRFSLNKAAAGNTASFVFQNNWSGRAEIGLTGDDNFHFKVSPNGSSWIDAIVYNVANSRLIVAGNITLSGWVAGSGVPGSGISLYGSADDTTGYNIYNSYFGPTTDNVSASGQAGLRWSVVYAATGSINTSDEREKQWRGGLTDAEFAAGRAIFAELGGFQFLNSIAEKGEAQARLHWGARAQRVAAILEAHGLNPNAYAFICHDAWDAVEEVPAEVEVRDGERHVVRPAVPGRPAGDRWGLRYDELIVFLLAVLDRRLSALEAGR